MSHSTNRVQRVSAWSSEVGAFDAPRLVATFHQWIREGFPGDLILVDVADYTHMADGPGVVLIAHEAWIGISRAGDQVKLSVQPRRMRAKNDDERLEQSWRLLGLVADRLPELRFERAGTVEESGAQSSSTL